MSGLVGWVDFRRDLASQSAVLHAMTETMRRRGPGAECLWTSSHAALGHRGSLAADRGGAQPAIFDTAGGTVALVHAGAIYNLAELRRDVEGSGGRLETKSDTDILLQAYLIRGCEFVDRLDGMFALAIWDGRRRRLTLARDRLGLKPLYYFEYAGGVIFASEPKGIMANPLFEARLDFSALPILLQPRLALPGETPLAGLREVPPARVLSYSQSGLSLRRYWRLASAPHEESFEDTARHVRGLMEDAVTRQLEADVPLGAMLSGGVDSTTVAALAIAGLRKEKSSGSLDTFCIRLDGGDTDFVETELRPEVDAPYAASAAEFIGSRHHTVTVDMQDLVDVIPETRRARDLPGWGQFDASMYLLFKEMRRSCDIALTGEAADEIFGGYPYFFKSDLIRRDHFPWLGDGPKLSDYLSPGLTDRIKPRADEAARYSELMADVPRLEGEDAGNARMREVLYLGMCGPLAVILDRKDRMSMALGLEVRLPFCDHRLVEYVWNVPWDMKCAGGVKGLLKAAMSDILPESTTNRKKSAYPHIQNQKYDCALIDEASRIVNDERSPVSALFDTPRMNGLIGSIGNGRLGTRSLPGGSAPAHMLIPIIEMDRWIEDYGVSLR